MTMERRNYDATLEVRAEGDGRTVVGIAVPYDVEQRIGVAIRRQQLVPRAAPVLSEPVLPQRRLRLFGQRPGETLDELRLLDDGVTPRCEERRPLLE